MTFQYPMDGPNAYFAAPCVPIDNTTERFVTEKGVEFVRTPEEAFTNLPGYSWEPKYVTIDGLRMHYIEDGPVDAAETIIMLHGQPSWSYLYRKMVPVLASRGIRVIAPDWIGMGRSDKPTSLSEHTYLKQIERLKSFILQVVPDVQDGPAVNLFVQDWGSLIGLRVVGDEPSWFRRVISANGNIPVFPEGFNPLNPVTPVNFNCSDSRTFIDMSMERFTSIPCGFDQSCFGIWVDFALTNPVWSPSEVLSTATVIDISEEELAAYDAPFDSSPILTSAIRSFPSMVGGVHEPEFGNIGAWESLKNFSRPFLALAGEQDPSLGSVQTQSNLYDNIWGASMHDFEHKRYEAHHFIQEDVGPEMAAYVADFLEQTKVETSVEEPTTQPPPETETVPDTSGVREASLPPCLLWAFLVAQLFRMFKF